MFDPNALAPAFFQPEQELPQEPEPDPTAPFGPEDPYKDYFGRKERFSVALGQEIFKKAENWKRMAESNGVMRQARENFRLYHNADPDGTTFGEATFSVVAGDEGETVKGYFNEFRNLLTHVLNMTTGLMIGPASR